MSVDKQKNIKQLIINRDNFYWRHFRRVMEVISEYIVNGAGASIGSIQEPRKIKKRYAESVAKLGH